MHALTRSEGTFAASALDTLIHSTPYDTLQATFARLDANGDGELDATELEAALAAEKTRADAAVAEKERLKASCAVLEAKVKALTTQLAAVGAKGVRRAKNEQALASHRDHTSPS